MKRHIAAIALFTAVAVALQFPGLANGPTLDGAVFTEMAVGLRAGLLPYRDLWDHKPPGVYLAFAAAQAVLPGADPWFGPWLLTAVATALVAALAYALVLPHGSRLALVAGLVVAVYLAIPGISLGGGQTEPLATLALMGAVLLALRSPASLRAAAVCGVLAGLAVATSFVAVPAVVAVGLLVAVPRMAERDRARGPKHLGVFALGCLAVFAVVTAAAAVSGILPSAWSAIVTFNGAYAALNRGRADGIGALGVASLMLLAPLIVACAAGAAGWMRARRRGGVRGIEMPVAAAVAWVIATALAIVASGRLEPHYLIVAIPPLVLLAAHAARTAFEAPGRARMAGIALVVLAVLAAVPAAMALGARAGSGVNRSQVDAVAAWLRSHASEGASLFAWGDEPELYYTSGLSPATPWIYVTPLLMPGYGGPELSEEVARDLVAEPPEFVVDAGSASPGDPGTVPMLVPRPVFEGDEWKLDTIDPIRDVVRDLYGSPVEVAGWLIYERLPAAAFE